MTRLFLVRHGQTEHNLNGLMQGWSDSPLTSTGIRQAQAVAKALATVPFEAAYSSPLQRTLSTAELVLGGRDAPPIEPHHGLRELNFGTWEERPDHQIWSRIDPKKFFFDLFRGGDGLPEGEDGPVFMARIQGAFNDILSRHSGDEPVLVVSHGVTLAAYLVSLGAVDFDALPLENAAVSILDVDPCTKQVVGRPVVGASAEDLSAPLRVTS